MPTKSGRRTMREIALNRIPPREQKVPGARSKSDVVRFLEKAKIVPGDCWEWTGHVQPSTGYGYFRYKGSTGAHRVSYLLLRGPVPAGMTIDHLCRNKVCVNPDHLEAVTHGENVGRAKPWLACDRLHPNHPTRLGQRSDGRQSCRECQRVRERERRARFAEKQAAAG